MMSHELATKLIIDMNLQGYRIYRYTKRTLLSLSLYEVVRYEGLPHLLFIKDKVNRHDETY